MTDSPDDALAADGADVLEGIDPPRLDERIDAAQFFRDLDPNQPR